MNKHEFLRNIDLFKDLNESQRHVIEKIIKQKDFLPGSVIISENNKSDLVYYLIEGEAVITKSHPESKENIKIATVSNGDLIGEIGVLDNQLRSATVTITKPSRLFIIPFKKLHVISVKHHSKTCNEKAHPGHIYLSVSHNLSKMLAKRIRFTNENLIQELSRSVEHMRARNEMGNLIISTTILLCVYIYLLKVVSIFFGDAVPSILSLIIGLAIGVCVILFIKNSSYPLSTYGITLKNWKKSLFEGLGFSLLVIPFIILYKWILLNTIPLYAGQNLFAIKDALSADNPLIQTQIVLIYLLFVPLQELTARGILQGSFETLLVTRHKYILAILMSNLLFSIIHIYLSLLLSITIFIPGIFWGWLYLRHRNLIGVTLSHFLIGLTALFTGFI